MPPAFQSYLAVDWSGAAKPKRRADSIWIGGYRRRADGLLEAVAPVNPPTRAAATEHLAAMLEGLLAEGRVLLGFDFPFGYPRGFADRLGLGDQGLLWRRVWTRLSDSLEDAPNNANNRFALAAGFNAAISRAPGPFWGCPPSKAGPYLTSKRPAPGPNALAERRVVEMRVPRAQSVWKLLGAGCVGSQALTGIPRVWQLRCDARFAFRSAIWPFETGPGDDGRADLVLAEIYPSLVPPLDLSPLPKDAGQVMAISRHFAEADGDGRLQEWLAAPASLPDDDRRAVLEEEGWVLGVS